MIPTLNQTRQLHGTAKTNTFNNIAHISVDNLKFRPILVHCGAYMYNATQVIVSYLKTLCNDNEYIFNTSKKLQI